MRVPSDLSCNTSNSRRSTGRLGWLWCGVLHPFAIHILWVWLEEYYISDASHLTALAMMCLATWEKKIHGIKFGLPLTSLKFNVIGRVPTRANYKNHPSLTLMDVPLTNSPHTVLWSRLFAKVISIWLIREAKWVHNHFYISCLLKIRRVCTTIC